MRIHLLSDLHLSVQGMEAPRAEADVVVLAGDLARPAAAIAWARALERPVVFVAGNHEFYGGDLDTTQSELQALAQGSTVQVLERRAWEHEGVRFLGCTLWSDHRLFDQAEERELARTMAVERVRDFSRIRVAPEGPLFTPEDARRLFDASVAWLDAQFMQAHPGPTVVVTHFAPSKQSIHPRFAGSPINACFVSDLEAQLERWQPALWLHGHVHDSFDYRIGATRVVANPRGYVLNGKVENEAFVPGLVVEVGR